MEREKITAAQLTDRGICPTCWSRAHGNSLFPRRDEQLLYENELFECALIDAPRAPGHAVIVSRAHFRDMTEIPDELCREVFMFAGKAMRAIREVYGAESVYLCTMCDGPMNHFHVQLIPRYAREARGSRNFVKERQPYRPDVGKAMKLKNMLENSAE